MSVRLWLIDWLSFVVVSEVVGFWGSCSNASLMEGIFSEGGRVFRGLGLKGPGASIQDQGV